MSHISSSLHTGRTSASYSRAQILLHWLIAALVVFQPRLTRIVFAAIAGSTPIASSTRLVFIVPLEQAEPWLTAIPAMSKRITCAVADRFGMAMARI